MCFTLSVVDRDRKSNGLTARLALEGAHVVTRPIRLDAGEFHWLAAFGARENADIRDAE
jgi:hypothetical protein